MLGIASWSGTRSIEEYTATQVEAARRLDFHRSVLRQLGSANVVLSVAGADSRVRSFCVWETKEGLCSEGLDIDKVQATGVPPNEVVQRYVAVTGAQLGDFLTAQKLEVLLSEGTLPKIEVLGEVVAPIGIVPDSIGRYPVVRLVCTPVQ